MVRRRSSHHHRRKSRQRTSRRRREQIMGQQLVTAMSRRTAGLTVMPAVHPVEDTEQFDADDERSGTAQLDTTQPTEPAQEATEDTLNTQSPVVGAPEPMSPTTYPCVRSVRLQCQLAHGSPTSVITNFENQMQFYRHVCEAFDLRLEDVLFCTVNTFKVDMDHLLRGHVQSDDLVFVHVRGQRKEVQFTKSASMLGVTVADNGICSVFIKAIQPASTFSKLDPAVKVGDCVLRIDDWDAAGRRHFEVSRKLKSLPVGKCVQLRLVEPLQSGFSAIGARKSTRTQKQHVDGLKTVRFKADGECVMTEGSVSPAMAAVNSLLGEYLNISDDALAQTLLDLAHVCDTSVTFAKAIQTDDRLQVLGMPAELLFDIWGAFTDNERAKESMTTATGGGGTAAGHANNWRKLENYL